MYKLINDDAEAGLRTIESSSVDVLISDIPYGVNINTTWDRKLPRAEVWTEAYRVLKPGAHCILFGQPSMTMDLMAVMAGTPFEYRDMWIWQYQGTHTKGVKVCHNGSTFRSMIRNVFNPIHVFRKKLDGTEVENWNKHHTNLFNIDANREPYEGNHAGILKRFESSGEMHKQSAVKSNTFKDMGRKGWLPDPRGREPVNVKYFGRATTKERTMCGGIQNDHETVKPIALMMWLINMTTFASDQVVLDPFCGTGSTGCACSLLNRNFIGIDIDEHCIDVATYRIENIDRIAHIFDKHRTPKATDELQQ